MTSTDKILEATPGSVERAPEPNKLRGDLNTFQLLFGILAFNGPLVGVMAFLPLAIGYGNGLGAPAAYIAAAVILGVFASGFLKMSRHVDNPGGFYSYVTLGLGKELGLGASFLAVVAYYTVLLGMYALMGVLISVYVAGTLGGPDIAWWIWAGILQVVVGIFGFFNIELSARVLTVFMCCEAILILAYNAAVVVQGGAAGLSGSSFLPSHIFSGGVGIALLFALLSFTGFEVTAVFRDEVRDPDRTIPRAAYGHIALVGIGYAVSTWVIIQAIGPASAVAATASDPTGSVTATVQTYLGAVAVDLVSILLMTSGFASLLAGHNILARYLFNLGVDGVLPRPIGAAHARHGSPYRAAILASGLIGAGYVLSVIARPDPSILYAQLWGVFGLALQILFLLTTVAIMVFMWRARPEDATLWHRLVAPGLALVGLGTTMVLAVSNIELLIPGEVAVTITVVVLVGSIVAGGAYARLLKTVRPAAYRHIGRR
ncbi:amino acid permease [Nocardioides aromaticivorans]|uniref:Amino acid permease n=1 Tax=Nocardioides aromaticivorans TaxID=200618 RepID=A0ABX7PG66_9ACTN|nr:APC family permease [Nocardioides aromaticivorans]QSR24884.1 amino acid permease [Nocardioides aromaticivorans]